MSEVVPTGDGNAVVTMQRPAARTATPAPQVRAAIQVGAERS